MDVEKKTEAAIDLVCARWVGGQVAVGLSLSKPLWTFEVQCLSSCHKEAKVRCLCIRNKQRFPSLGGGGGGKTPISPAAGQGPLVQHGAGSEHTADMRATVRSDQVLSLNI